MIVSKNFTRIDIGSPEYQRQEDDRANADAEQANRADDVPDDVFDVVLHGSASSLGEGPKPLLVIPSRNILLRQQPTLCHHGAY